MRAILTLNAGSSSLKFALYQAHSEPVELASGQVENLGPAARLSLVGKVSENHRTFVGEKTDIGAADHKVALSAILRALEPFLNGAELAGIGHRIVHGGAEFAAPVVLTDDVTERLGALIPLAPLHQPNNLAGLDAAKAAFPDAIQIGCFDTAFHHGHPWVNDTFGLPRRFYDEGVRRYGFHGLSYDYITGKLTEDWPDLPQAKVVIAHLGNGASMCAVREGRSVGSTMGFSALDGLPMGTRCGQLDPGALLYMMGKGLDVNQITQILYRESGLKGLSGISPDMRTLLASDAPEARQAIDYYVFRIRRELGAMSAVLGGIDALVFCGGIGENAPQIRARVLEGMEYLGLSLDGPANDVNATDISDGPTQALVIPTDEERVIARAVAAAIYSG